jgi:ribosomal subunit interface protein
MNITFQATNLELNDEIRSMVEKKLNNAFRAFGDMNLDPVQIDIQLERTTRRHPQERETEQLYRAEANVSVPGRLIRAEGTAGVLEQAVVSMKRKLTREIRVWRTKRIDGTRAGARTAKETIRSDTGEIE